MAGAYRIKIEPCDPGAVMSEDSFNLAVPQSDTIYSGDRVFQGIVKISPDNLLPVRIMLAKLNLGYQTNLVALQIAINNLAP
jgi:hypothetical protein